MRYSEIAILAEKAIRLDADGHPITVLENPSADQILGLLSRSPEDTVKGLIIGPDLYFWASTSKATHGHIAEKLWPTVGSKAYWEYPEYIDGRLIIELDRGHPTLDFEPALLQNPRMLLLLKSDKLYFHFPGAGFLNYSEYILRTKRVNAERMVRMNGGRMVEGTECSSFADHMIDACTNSEMGFYFEEGGCWGMALALFDWFEQHEKHPQIVITEGDGHAMVQVDGVLYDHQGKQLNNRLFLMLRSVTPEQMVEIAVGVGVTREEIMNDKEQADEIISNADELAADE